MLCKRSKNLPGFRLSLMLSVLAVGCPVYGATDQPATRDLLDLSLEELQQIKVTVASPFRESDLVVGSTVALITERDWQLAGAQRTSDAISHLPATLITPTVFGGDAIAIRGYAVGARGLATLIDGVPVNNFATGSAQYGPSNVGLGVLKNIEMIRGPGSAIYGSDAFHGVFALNTFESEADLSQLNASMGSTGYYQGSFHDSHQLTDSVRSNIALSARGQGNQDRRYSYTDSNGNTQSASRDLNYDSQTAVIKLASDEEQLWSYRLGFYWDSYQAEEFPGFGRSLSGNQSALANKDWAGADNRFAMANLSITRQLPYDITAQLNNFYWHNTTLWLSSRRTTNSGVGEVMSDEVNSRQGSELLFKQADNVWHTQWVAAVGYNKAQVDNAQDSSFAPDGSLLSSRNLAFDGLDRTIKDVYLQARTSLYDGKLELLYGGRIDDYPNFGIKRTPRMGVVFLPQADRAYKFLYGEAFRAPVASELTSSALSKGDPDLKPETSKSYELIFMQRWGSSKFELTLFENQWWDGIATMPSTDPNFSLEFANVSRNNSRGVEVSYQLISHHWLADLSASYVKSKNVLTDQVYVMFPRVMLNAGIGYQLDRGWQLYWNNRFFTDATVGPVNSLIPHPESLPSYWRADLHISKDLSDDVQLLLDIKNLFDRQNYSPSMASAEDGYLGEPFSLTLGMRYKF